MVKKQALKIILTVLISLFAAAGFSACGGESGEADSGTTSPDVEQSEPADESSSETQEEYINYADDHYVKFQMWDYTDMGSGASNDDPNFERYWTVAYDPDTKECTDVEEGETYILGEEDGGYDYSVVTDREEKLRDEVFADMDFVDVGIMNDGIGRFAGVNISYHDLDNPDNRAILANNGFLCMQADWCTTIDNAVETISSLHGEIVRANIIDADDACIYAKCVALKRGDITPNTDAVIECDQQTENGYSIHAYENLPDHTATIFWWTVSEDGSITDEILGDEITGEMTY